VIWELAAFLDRLASFRRVIIFDKRGTGMSDPVSGVPGLEEHVDDVIAVMDAAGSARACIAGWGDGAFMAAMFAATYPERVSALILGGLWLKALAGRPETRRGGEVTGLAVHVGARVAALAGASEVLVTSTVQMLVLGSGIGFADRGSHTLKGVPEQWRLFAVEHA
jgi:pimeloyl-ACP methyl ester carboxylesterase